MKLYSNRTGSLYHVQSNYDCYVPKSLYDITISIDEEMNDLLNDSNYIKIHYLLCNF